MGDDVGVSRRAETTPKDNADPGACRHGNFINYYQFHPAEDRLKQLPRDVWHADAEDRKYIGLDVGCNSGELTQLLHDFLRNNLSNVEEPEVSLLGVDLDPILIERAEEKNDRVGWVTYEHLDLMTSARREEVLGSYLAKHNRKLFDVAFCFSITMWIHLNHGDEGLKDFLKLICDKSRMIVIEPQNGKSYRTASRRLRRANKEDFSFSKNLSYTNSITSNIERILLEDCSFQKVVVTEANDWGRQLLIYKRRDK